jgi:uncharacterized protein
MFSSNMPWDFWLIFLVLGVALPWRGRMRLNKMLATPGMSSHDRIVLYASTIVLQWVAVAVTAWRAGVRGLAREDLALVVHAPLRNIIVTIVGAATLGGLQWLNLRRMGKASGRAYAFMQALAERILPQSPKELLPYFALALTAGLCEEFLYRGFAMAALAHAGLAAWAAVLISSILFGLAHLYQGRGGFVGTLVIGTVFGIARIAYDSLIPAMAWHFAIDAVAGVAGPRYLVRAKEPDASPSTSAAMEL